MMNAMMKRGVLSVLVALVLSGGAFGQSHSKSVADRPGSRELYLQRQYLLFTRHNTTFMDFAHNHIEQDLTMEFAREASAASGHASAVGVLLTIYDQLSCRADRAMAWPLIKAELASYVALLDTSAKAVDHSVASYVKTPAVATAAARMKQDIGELKSFLESTEKEQR